MNNKFYRNHIMRLHCFLYSPQEIAWESIRILGSSFIQFFSVGETRAKKKRGTLRGYFLLGFFDTLIMCTIEVITEFAT